VSSNTALTTLHCHYNQLTSLDLSGNTGLTDLRCGNNQLASLDLSSNPDLLILIISSNQISSLDLSNNSALQNLYCGSNQLTSLDVSNTSLSIFNCTSNQLTYLNVKGLEDQLNTFTAVDNSLTCIETLDPSWATENWTYANGNIDEGVTFSVICGSEDQDVWHVATTGSDIEGNGTQESPFATIQTGINAAGAGNTVHVAEGTYVENINYNGKNITVLGEDRETTIIDGNQDGSVVSFGSGENSNAVLDGFTIQNGLANYGGIKVGSGTSPTLKNLIVKNNYSYDRGGGIFITSASPTLSDMVIKDNYGSQQGGGIAIYGNSNPSMSNMLIINNSTNNNGGGINLVNNGTMTLTNVTIANNSANAQGGGIYCQNSTSSNLINCIVWNNLPQEIVLGPFNDQPDIVSISYCDIQDGQDSIVVADNSSVIWGEGNIDSDPLFCEPDSANFHFAGNSPCAGTGEEGADMGALGVGCDDIWFPPVIAAMEDTSMDEDSELMLQLSAESEQGYDIYFEAESDTSNVYVYVEGDMLHINLETDWNGSSEITVLAYSEFSYESNDTARFTLTVNPVDDLPFVDGHILPRYYPEDFGVDTIAYLPDVFVDIDGELTFSYSFTDSSVLAADVSSDHLVLSSIADAHGETELLVTATNPTRASVTDTVQLSVWPVNDAPVVSIPDTSMNEDSEFFYDLSDYITDVDSEDLLVSLNHVSEPMSEHVIFQMMGPDTLRMFSRNNWFGTGNVRIRVNDGQIATNDPFTLTVNPVNDAPVFGNLSALVGVGIEFQVPIHVYDVDMDSLVVSFDDSWDYPDWLSLAADPYRLEGTAPSPGQSHFPLDLSDGDTSVTDTFTLSAAFFHPRITSVTDIPNDQGGRVYVNFLKSFFDHPNESNQMYTVFRHDIVDNAPDWVVVGSGAAIGEGSYTYEVATLKDSTSEGDGMTQFKVVASMDEGHFHSLPVSGYSTDNIAPGVPQGLMALHVDDGIQITWEMSADEDFQYYMLEKSSDEAFTEPEVFETIDIAYLDLDYVLNESNYYRLAAVDHAGNMSDYSDVVDIAVLAIDLDLIPEVFALHQNYPNPFNPTTQIKYDLPEDAMVSITIYDVMGRRVKLLVSTTQSAGYRSIQWDATNNLGEPVSAGMYIYIIQAGEFRQTKKMVLLK